MTYFIAHNKIQWNMKGIRACNIHRFAYCMTYIPNNVSLRYET